MKTAKKSAILAMMVVFVVSAIGVGAQTQTDSVKTRQRVASTPTEDTNTKGDQKPAPAPKSGERLEPVTSRTSSDVAQDTQANRQEQSSEEAAVAPYYNNFFTTYRIGPEDVISVQVFGQDRYSRSGI